MPNIRILKSDNPDDTVAHAVIGIRAIGPEFRAMISDVLDEASKEAERTAKALAPRGNSGKRTGRIRDSIFRQRYVAPQSQGGGTESIRYHPGGAGGGGFYEARVFATAAVAPHLRFVYEGTPWLIEPRLDNRGGRNHHGVLAIQKRGEPVHFRMWSHGQTAQQDWWETAQRRASEVAAEKIRTFKPHDRP